MFSQISNGISNIFATETLRIDFEERALSCGSFSSLAIISSQDFDPFQSGSTAVHQPDPAMLPHDIPELLNVKY